MLTVAIIAPGNMGAAIGHRLKQGGARVLTSLAGRSSASAARAEEAGLEDATDATLAEADVILLNKCDREEPAALELDEAEVGARAPAAALRLRGSFVMLAGVPMVLAHLFLLLAFWQWSLVV